MPETDPLAAELAAMKLRYAARPGDVERLISLAETLRGLIRDSDGRYLPPDCHIRVGEFQDALADTLTGPHGATMPQISDGKPLDYLKTWHHLWASIVQHPDGTLNAGQVARELADYADLMGWASEVYQHVTNGRIGKVNTLPSAVISVADDYTDDLIGQAMDDLIEAIEGEEPGPLRCDEIVALIRRLADRPAPDPGVTDD